jgi:hypothetical protein
MDLIYVLVHRKYGPISTFLTLGEAKAGLNRVLQDEPTWTGDFTIEPFRLEVAEPTERGKRRKGLL